MSRKRANDQVCLRGCFNPSESQIPPLNCHLTGEAGVQKTNERGTKGTRVIRGHPETCLASICAGVAFADCRDFRPIQPLSYLWILRMMKLPLCFATHE